MLNCNSLSWSTPVGVPAAKKYLALYLTITLFNRFFTQFTTLFNNNQISKNTLCQIAVKKDSSMLTEI